MNKTILTGAIAAAALVVGTTGAVAANNAATTTEATTTEASTGADEADCCGGLKGVIEDLVGSVHISDSPYYVSHDVNLDQTGTTVEGSVSAGVYEDGTDRQVVGVDVPVDKTGVEPGSVYLDPDVGSSEPIITIQGDAVCLGAVCAPGKDIPVGVPTPSVRAGDGGNGSSAHVAGASVNAEVGDFCADPFTGCGDTDGDARVGDSASVSSPTVSTN